MSVAPKAEAQPRQLLVETIMTTNVRSIALDMTVRKAIGVLVENRISGAPVIDSLNTVLSVVSEGDLLKLAASVGLEKPIGQCLSKLKKASDLVTLKKQDTFSVAYKMFLTHGVHRVIVVDANGKLQGIVSRSNILRIFVETRTDELPIAGEAAAHDGVTADAGAGGNTDGKNS